MRAFDTKFRTTLVKDAASVDVSRAQAQQALEDAKTLVQDARDLVVGDAPATTLTSSSD